MCVCVRARAVAFPAAANVLCAEAEASVSFFVAFSSGREHVCAETFSSETFPIEAFPQRRPEVAAITCGSAGIGFDIMLQECKM